MKKYCNVLCSSLLLLSAAPTIAQDISILVLYTEAAEAIVANGAIEDRIEAYIDASNDSYVASNVDITLNLAEAHLIAGVDDSRDATGKQYYDTDTALRDLTNGRGSFINVPDLRNTFGADFVVLLRDIQDTGGLGWVDNQGNREDLAYNIVRIQNPLSTFTHELGHNMGLAHSRRQVDNGGVVGVELYAAGYGIERDNTENGFVTIMAYNSAFNGAQSIDLISTPYIDCNTGTSIYKCGIHENDNDNGANGAKVLNDRKAVYSSFRAGPTVGSVTFKDSNLAGCAALSQSTLITNFTNFDCVNQGVNSLTGIETLSEIVHVNFQNNNLYSLQPLFDLPNLEVAIVSGNDNIICSHLTQLESKLGSGNLTRSNECFPLVSTLVAINSLLLN